ncbi:endo-1,4-beta-xylanase [Tessaracoccus sp. MC1679]|uniref:endo-1,4-beta-xylanase n=1 Tax=Tessaracoccus sp. MC1679 TaxID=2760313 RepID=UPI001602B0A5|nr:endo-1,4-beta-xylanase [Tessaracoccus sp. MC1679]MBB1517060.1 endo-1,4-beta-xylanase [Tessaracoccus sp. MC1679]
MVAAGADPALYGHRMGSARLSLGDGAAGRPVTVRQTRHGFGFGNIGFDLIGLANGEEEAPSTGFGQAPSAMAEGLAAQWLELFNTVTLPFYWRTFEPAEGHPDTRRLQAAARWFRERGVTVKGHPLVWHTLAPEWLLGRPNDEVRRRIEARVTREVTDFAGLVDQWDAINEVVILPDFTAEDNAVTALARELGRVEMVRLAFETARNADPSVRLVLNDFNMSARYEALIEEVLAAGIRLDAIGLQSHMHQGYWGEERTLEVLSRFGRFGLPLQFTETSLVSGEIMPAEIVDLNDYQVPSWPSTVDGEARQADEVSRHYRTLVEHRSVEAITYWGITDAGAWLGAPIGLIRADGTPKPSFEALRGLIRGEWWVPETSVVADERGEVAVEGFAGDYEAVVDGRGTAFNVAAGSETGVDLSR